MANSNAPNPFDRFDPPPAPEAPPPGQNPFDRFDPDYGTPGYGAQQGETLTSIAESPFVGINRGIAEILGAPGDAANWVNSHFGIAPGPWTTENVEKLMGAANPETHPSQGWVSALGQAAGHGASAMIVPEAAIGSFASAVPRLAGTAETLGTEAPELLRSAFGQSQNLTGVARNAAIGAAGGLTGQAAADVVPDQYKPYAEMAGNLIGGGAGALGAYGAQWAGRVGREAATEAVKPFWGKAQPVLDASGRPVLQPVLDENGQVVPGSQGAPYMVKPGQLDIAHQDLVKQAADPYAALHAAQTNNPNMVPGSPLSLAQLSDDIGLRGYEKSLPGRDWATQVKFNELQAQQNKGQTAYLEGIQPTGNEVDLPTAITNQFKAIDDQYAQLDAAARQQAQESAAAHQSGLQPETRGAALTAPLATENMALKKQENDLFNILRAQNPVLDISPLADARAKAYEGLSFSAKSDLSPDEKSVNNLVKKFQGFIPGENGEYVEPKGGLPDSPPAIDFNEFQDFKQKLGKAIRTERITNGDSSPSLRRLNILQSGIYGSIDNTIADSGMELPPLAGAQSAPTPASQTAPLEDRIRSAVGQIAGFPQQDGVRLSDLRAALPDVSREALDNELMQQFESGRATLMNLDNPREIEQQRPYAIPYKGQELSVLWMKPKAPGGLPEAAITPNFTEEQRQILDQARAVSAQRAQLFKTGPVGNVMAPGPTANSFQLSRAVVPENLFVKGAEGGQTIDAARAAAGATGNPQDIQQFESALRNHVADNFADYTMKDGVVDPAKHATWLKQYAPALSRMDPTFMQGFQDSATAAEKIGQIASERKAVIDNFQQGAVKKLIGIDDPLEVKRRIGLIFSQPNAVSQMQHLVGLASKDPNALAGLRKAVVQYIKDTYIGNTQAGAGFQTFVRKNRPVLQQVFTPEHVDRLQAIADQIAMIKGPVKAEGSPTAPNLGSAKKSEIPSEGSIFSKLWKSMLAGGELGGGHGAFAGALAAIGSTLVGKARNAGLKTVDDFLVEAMRNHELGTAVLAHAPKRPNVGSAVTLEQQLKRIALVGAMSGQRQQKVDSGPSHP